ncbi:transglycosylase family protein [Streptomyces sp. NBC_00347]|uniref:transglycosylase family protein n=1 Tax=Streptomyces sp. NBC_00347 TaxID=2975721 RepID=UPI002B1D0586|nr:transglycosylase family protein [Streptomyces sp. NBC_00347]
MRNRTLKAAVATASITLILSPLLAGGSAQAASVATWDKVAECEAGGNWSINTGNGFYGGLQIQLSTWNGYGGKQYASYPHQATKKQQILIGEKILAGQGPGAWPNCNAGLATDHADPYPAEPPAPVGMVHLTAADFTGNGKADLVGVESATGKLWLYPGTGSGTFGARIQIGSGWGAMSKLSAADFTGDGKADLLAVENATGAFYAYPGTGAANGTSTLGARTQIGSGWGSMRDLTAVDVNKDAKPDLLAIDGNGALWSYQGTGSLAGTNTLGARTQIGSGWGGMTELTVPGDLNADGKPDLLAVDAAGALWKYPTTGSLAGMNTLGARNQVGSNWDSMRQLVGADFNGDGKGDLDAVEAPSGSTGDFFFYPGNGSGGFGARAQIGSGW